MSDPRLPALDSRAERALAGRLGRPLSLKSIAAVRDAVISAYRRRHRPFVLVTTPPQEITGGVLHLRVLEYRLGAVAVTGAAPGEAAKLRTQVRARPGEPINGQELAEDLKWANSTPGRSISVIMSPGRSTGDVDLELRVTPTRLWRVYGGAASSDSPQSGDARLFVGAQLGSARILGGAWLSYQFTGSPDRSGGSDAFYRSHAARLDLQAAPGLMVEASLDRVDSRRNPQNFVTDQAVSEGSLSVRAPFARPFGVRAPWLSTADASAGLEVRHAERQASFGGVPFQRSVIDVYQLRAQLAGEWEQGGARGGGSLTLHVSPGGLGEANSDAAYRAYSFGQPVSARYAYVALSAFVRLPLTPGVTYLGEVQAQVSTAELPETEKAGVGGANLVRGAVLDDGAFSRQLVLRNTAYGPAARFGAFTVRPHAFFDLGYGAVDAAHPGRVLTSIGFGGETALRENLVLSATLACALSRGNYTQPADCRAVTRLSAAY